MVFSNINHAVRRLLTIFGIPKCHFFQNSPPSNPIFSSHTPAHRWLENSGLPTEMHFGNTKVASSSPQYYPCTAPRSPSALAWFQKWGVGAQGPIEKK